MKKTLLRIITVLATLSILLAMAVVPASAALYNSKNIYMKIDGIEGEAKDAQHEKWIDLLTFNHGSAQSIQTGTPDAAGRGIFEPVVFKHVVDKATPRLQEACMQGNHIRSAQIDFCRAIAGKQEVVYSVKLEEIKVVKAEVEVEDLADGDCQLVETVSLLVNKMTWTETTIGFDNTIGGNIETSFDQSKRASMFDSNTDIVLVAVCAIVFVLLVIAVIFFVSKKKKTAVANAPVDTSVNDK